jgi:hypothetical protein
MDISDAAICCCSITWLYGSTVITVATYESIWDNFSSLPFNYRGVRNQDPKI